MKDQLNIMVILFTLITVISLMLLGCSKANEMDLQKNTGNDCDTVNMAYQANIQPILAANCYSCHGDGPVLQAGINLKIFDNVKIQVENGNLIGTITHAPGYPAMPYNLPMLAECSINKIKDWINRGALNN